MQLVVFEDSGCRNLLPLVYSRATFNLRCGFDNLLDKIETAAGQTAAAVFVRPRLAAVIAERQPRPVNTAPGGDDQLWINGRFLLRRMPELPRGGTAWQGRTLAAAHLDARTAMALTPDVLLDPDGLRAAIGNRTAIELLEEDGRLIEHPWDLVHVNAEEIERQFLDVDVDKLGLIYPGAHLLNDAAIHVGEGSKIYPSVVLDAEDGPIFIGEGVIVRPNATIIGPCFIGDRCVVQPGALIRGGCAIHMVCKVGGEIDGCIFHGYSNKQHDGFLGHSYVGEWVNLGADTVNSDLKNTYGSVKVPINGKPVDSGHTFVGAFIGDHAKTGINTVLPTGGVVGYAASLFSSRHAPQFTPSFSWVTDAGVTVNKPDKALEVARKVVARRNRSLSPAEEALFLGILGESQKIESRS